MAGGAEGEGFEPSIRLTTDNGFRAPARLACLSRADRLRDKTRDSRSPGARSTSPQEAAEGRLDPLDSARWIDNESIGCSDHRAVLMLTRRKMSTRPRLRRLLAASASGCTLALAVASSASVAASGAACNPRPGLGSLALVRSGKLHLIDLATCRDRVVRTGIRGQVEFGADGRVHVVPRSTVLRSPDGRYRATVRVAGKQRTLRDTIWVRDTRTGRSHAVFSAGAWGATTGLDSPGPIVLLGWSGDNRWLFFAIDPGGSASIAADGLILRVVSVAGGAAHKLATMLTSRDYFRWCGGRLVFTAGGDRIATHNKRLLVARPPAWRPRPLVRARSLAWGSLACAPDGRSLVVQSQPESNNAYFFATRWSLWRVGLDGSRRRLTSPPRGYADESPRISRNGTTVLFVRSHKGVGKLYALRHGKLLGPLLTLGYSLGYYGHQDWWQTMDWSLATSR